MEPADQQGSPVPDIDLVVEFTLRVVVPCLYVLAAIWVFDTHVRKAAHYFRKVSVARQEQTYRVAVATRDVQRTLTQMAYETPRAQSLAWKIGVATALGGAILGAFAGALAANLMGG